MLKRRPRCSTTSKFLCASSTPSATKSSHTSVRSGYSATSQAPTSNCIRSMRRGTNSGKIAKPIAFSKSPSTSSNGSSTKRALVAKHRLFRDEPPCDAIRVLKPCVYFPVSLNFIEQTRAIWRLLDVRIYGKWAPRRAKVRTLARRPTRPLCSVLKIPKLEKIA